MKNLLTRFKEPSTWAALAALSVAFGVRPETANAVVGAVGAVADVAGALGVTPHDAAGVLAAVPTIIAGAVAVFLPERK